ncbi:Asp/Glu/hydantoin racemase [Leucosporidium creatinivorum]|uniref:Asp/Glu/hydantoin racemase n=1 Tax=Leucosporidium creatinivorum TaxID=106004 RepID=A0A1Y2G858_9BASI|nr:Asp/Glu/hydantoin racemase [Leucosporidium creatinivorum]
MASSLPILIINPNTTTAMTDGLREMLAPFVTTPPTCFTAPTGVNSINSSADCHLSATHVLPHLLDPSSDLLESHSAILIACYSEHPLVPSIKEHTTKPVTGIFEASVSAALLLLKPEQSFGIVSTGKVWEELLSTGVANQLGAETSRRFAGVETTGLTAVELHDAPAEEVREKMKDATKRLLRRGNVGAVCLGCAGMAGMEEMVREACVEEKGEKEGRDVRIIDGAKAGVALLEGLVKLGM